MLEAWSVIFAVHIPVFNLDQLRECNYRKVMGPVGNQHKRHFNEYKNRFNQF
jgi:hypothetical protein